MTGALRVAMQFILLLLMLLGLLISLPVRVLRVIMNADRYWQVYVYYGWVKLKRWTFDEPRWQEHDLKIGITPPADHPWWKTQGHGRLVEILDDRQE